MMQSFDTNCTPTSCIGLEVIVLRAETFLENQDTNAITTYDVPLYTWGNRLKRVMVVWE